jgi:DNA-binding NtrC family response regulator
MPALSPDASDLLETYSWPGNVRELENTLMRLAVLAGDEPITVAVIESDPGLRQSLVREPRSRRPEFSLKLGEQEQIERAIEAAGGNRKRAAKLLGVSRATLYRKLARHGL